MKWTRRSIPVLLAAGWIGLLTPASALAYVGPGAGLSAIGSLLALIAALAVAVFGFLWFPIRSYRRKRRRRSAEATAPAAQSNVQPAAEEPSVDK